MEFIERFAGWAWPDFKSYNEYELKRYLLWSLAVFGPAFLYYAVVGAVAAAYLHPLAALAVAPQLCGLAFLMVFVSLVGSRWASCAAELCAVVMWKLGAWGLLLGSGRVIGFIVTTSMLWYVTSLTRACFALAHERLFARW